MIAAISLTHNDEGGFQKFDSHKIYWEQGGQRKADEFLCMDGKMMERFGKETNVAKG